jgi:predicted nucleic-acid-binding protein
MKNLDANLLLRLILADIPEQAAAIESLFADAAQTYAIADMAFAEIVWILHGATFSYSREHVALNLQAILKIEQINCNRAMLERAVPLYVHHPGISFVDACLAAYAELNGAKPLLTFDKRLAKALPDLTAVL